MDYGNLAALKAAIAARIKNNGVGGKNRASDLEQSYDDLSDTLFARNDEKTTSISDLESDVGDIFTDIGTLETEVENIKRPSTIAFTAAIPFTLPSAKTSATVDQDYTLSIGAEAVADSYHSIVSTGNEVNTINFPSAWINGNSGTFDNTKIQRIMLYYDGTYVTYTITDLADLPDTTNPTVTIASTESGTTSVNPIPLTFTLSEVSTDFVVGDVIVTNGTLENFAGSGVDYTADLVPTTDGAITVNIPADSFTDAAGNGNDAATPFNITYEEALSYPTWANTQSMVIDATGEGVQVIDSALYPSNGGSDDKAVTTEIIHKTPSTINSSILFFSKDSTLTAGLVVVGVTGTGDVYITLQIDTGNKITFSPAVAAPLVADTWYHIVHTYDGNQDSPGVTLKINNTVHALNAVETGNYTGLPDLIGDYLIEIPRNAGASFGDGYCNLVRMYNKALTSSEITSAYNARVSGGLTGLNDLIEACQLELRFEGNGNAAIGTNGTLVGSPTYIAETP